MKHKNNESGLPKSEPETAGSLHLGYIERRWEIIAAVAWKEYLAHGRGALLFTTGAEPDGEWDCRNCIYLPLDRIEGHPLMREYSKMVMAYDPAKQIVALFLTPPGRVSAYRGGLTPERVAPPDAYKRVGDLLDSN